MQSQKQRRVQETEAPGHMEAHQDDEHPVHQGVADVENHFILSAQKKKIKEIDDAPPVPRAIHIDGGIEYVGKGGSQGRVRHIPSIKMARHDEVVPPHRSEHIQRKKDKEGDSEDENDALCHFKCSLSFALYHA